MMGGVFTSRVGMAWGKRIKNKLNHRDTENTERKSIKISKLRYAKAIYFNVACDGVGQEVGNKKTRW